MSCMSPQLGPRGKGAFISEVPHVCTRTQVAIITPVMNTLYLTQPPQLSPIHFPLVPRKRGWRFPSNEVPVHRGTSLTRKRSPLGPYRRPMPRVLWGSYGGWAFSYGRGPRVGRALWLWDRPSYTGLHPKSG